MINDIMINGIDYLRINNILNMTVLFDILIIIIILITILMII